MTFAIAILNFNGSVLLKRFIPKIIENCSEAKLYVIDNNSNDNSVELISEKYPEINLIRLDNNYGYAKGYNLGIKKIDEDVIFFSIMMLFFLIKIHLNTYVKRSNQI